MPLEGVVVFLGIKFVFDDAREHHRALFGVAVSSCSCTGEPDAGGHNNNRWTRAGHVNLHSRQQSEYNSPLKNIFQHYHFDIIVRRRFRVWFGETSVALLRAQPFWKIRLGGVQAFGKSEFSSYFFRSEVNPMRFSTFILCKNKFIIYTGCPRKRVLIWVTVLLLEIESRFNGQSNTNLSAH